MTTRLAVLCLLGALACSDAPPESAEVTGRDARFLRGAADRTRGLLLLTRQGLERAQGEELRREVARQHDRRLAERDQLVASLVRVYRVTHAPRAAPADSARAAGLETTPAAEYDAALRAALTAQLEEAVAAVDAYLVEYVPEAQRQTATRLRDELAADLRALEAAAPQER